MNESLHNKILEVYSDGKGVTDYEGRALAKMTSELGPASTIVEIGSYLGRSSAYLTAGSPQDAITYMIDLWDRSKLELVSEENQYAMAGEGHRKEAVRRLEKLGLFSKVVMLQGVSGDFALKWTKPIDFLFIDGDHNYEGIRRDYEAWAPFVKTGSRIAFHDFSPRWPGVIDFISKIVAKELDDPVIQGTVWSGRKYG